MAQTRRSRRPRTRGHTITLPHREQALLLHNNSSGLNHARILRGHQIFSAHALMMIQREEKPSRSRKLFGHPSCVTVCGARAVSTTSATTAQKLVARNLSVRKVQHNSACN